jgi:CDP-glycerol glycerophosphotransferase
MKLKKIKKGIKTHIDQMYYLKCYYKKKIEEDYVLIESKQGEDLAGNMFYTLKEIVKNHKKYNVFLVATEQKQKSLEKLLKKHELENVKIVIYKSFDYYRLLATSKYLFNDTSFPMLFTKREGQVYTNTWHGTPLKQMGKDVVNRRYAIGNIKRNFMFTDYLVYPNDEMKEKMLDAYGLNNIYRGTILNAGYPRNSVFFDRKSEKKIREKLKLEGKKVIVYMPTWRGVMTKKKQGEQFKEIIELMRYMEDHLTDDQVFYVKMHVLVQKDLKFGDFKHIKSFPTGMETYEVLNIADVLVTDYSSVFFDFANTKKKIVLYTYDEEEYTKTRGFYYSLNELPFPKTYTPKELLEEVNKPKNYDDTEFLKKFCTYDNIEAPKALVDYVLDGKKSKYVKPENVKNDGRENTLMYASTLGLNGITSSLISLTNLIDLKKENIVYCFRQKALSFYPMRVTKLPENTDVFPICGGYIYSFREIIANILFYRFNINTRFVKKYIDRMYKREVIRLFGNAKFDKVIHFTGYEKRITGLFERFDAKRAIFVHNDMVSEIKTKGNQHYKTLKEAYNKYDKVVAVSEDIIEPIKKISGRDDNITIVHNAHDYKTILEKAEKEIAYSETTVANVSEKILKKLLDMNYIKFINIARYSAEKGQRRLIDAFEKFYKKHENSLLIIIGGYGKLYDELHEYIKHLDCRYNVILIKSIDNPFPILKKCNLFILSSFYEALGLVLLEADTCKVPCFSTDVRGPRGFMKKYGGTLVENSEEGILKGMNDFMDGKIKCMNFDAEKYNQEVKKEYENIFK